MTSTNVKNRTQAIFRDIFNDPNLVIYDSMTAYDLDDWDSLNHVNLMSAIQKEFEIKFELSELERLNNVGDIIKFILKKTKK
jgi:acyl carrier protein